MLFHNYCSWHGQGFFLLATTSGLALGPIQPPIQEVPGALSPGVKQLEPEAEHSPPSSAKIKNEWSYTSTPPYVFMVWWFIKQRICLNGKALR